MTKVQLMVTVEGDDLVPQIVADEVEMVMEDLNDGLLLNGEVPWTIRVQPLSEK